MPLPFLPRFRSGKRPANEKRNAIVRWRSIGAALAAGFIGWLATSSWDRDNSSAQGNAPRPGSSQSENQQPGTTTTTNQQQADQDKQRSAPRNSVAKQISDYPPLTVSIDSDGKVQVLENQAGPETARDFYLLDASSGNRVKDAPSLGSNSSTRTYMIYNVSGRCFAKSLELTRKQDGSLSHKWVNTANQQALTRPRSEINPSLRSTIASCADQSLS